MFHMLSYRLCIGHIIVYCTRMFMYKKPPFQELTNILFPVGTFESMIFPFPIGWDMFSRSPVGYPPKKSHLWDTQALKLKVVGFTVPYVTNVTSW